MDPAKTRRERHRASMQEMRDKQVINQADYNQRELQIREGVSEEVTV